MEREGERESQSQKVLEITLTTDKTSPCNCLRALFSASWPHPSGCSCTLTPPQSLGMTWLHIQRVHTIRHRYNAHQHELQNRQTHNCTCMKILTLSTKLNTEIILDPVRMCKQ